MQYNDRNINKGTKDKKIITFTQIFTEAYQGAGIPSTDSVNINLFKRNTNNGLKLLKSAAMQYFTRKEKTANLVAGQQYYTLDVDSIRPRQVRINNGSLIFPIPNVESETEWNSLNIIPQFAVFYPQRWFVRGPNEIGVWPIPSANLTNALILAYDSRMADMYLDDVTGIPITVTQNSTAVTTTTGQFTPQMVGMKFTFTDGSDGQWYTIVGYNNDNSLVMENFYQNTTQTSSSTLIGSVPDIPEEFHQALEFYDLWMYYENQRGSLAKATKFQNDFLYMQELYMGTFGDKESSQVILPRTNFLAYNPLLVPPMNLGS